MLYAGKTPEQMTADELEEAEAKTLAMMAEANRIYLLNKAGYEELSAEQQRRFRAERLVN